jgi:hypothetical protein
MVALSIKTYGEIFYRLNMFSVVELKSHCCGFVFEKASGAFMRCHSANVML